VKNFTFFIKKRFFRTLKDPIAAVLAVEWYQFPWTKAGGVQPSAWPEWMRNFKDY
jgi:hypothetical protein